MSSFKNFDGAPLSRFSGNREDPRKRIRDLLERRQGFVDRAYADELAATNRAQRQDDVNFGNDAAQGAMAGSQFGPWGALAGGILGSAKGQYEAYGRRRDEGRSVLGALGTTLFDFKNSIPSNMSLGQSAAGAVGKAVAGQKARNAPVQDSRLAAMETQMGKQVPVADEAAYEGGDQGDLAWEIDPVTGRRKLRTPEVNPEY